MGKMNGQTRPLAAGGTGGEGSWRGRLGLWVRRGLLGLLGLVTLLAMGGSVVSVQGAPIEVSLTLEPGVTAVGEPVQLNFAVKGSQKVRQPPAIEVDGAQVQYLGPSLQTTLNNTELSVTMTHRYYLVPQRAGELVVPPVTVEIDGQNYRSEPAVLKVLEPGQPNAPEVNQGAFVEVEIPRRPVFVGESFPAEIRLLVPSEVRWRIEAMPTFDSESFLKTPFQQPQQRIENRQGRPYDVLVFRTALTAIKSGTVPLGDITIKLQMASVKKRQNSPFGGLFDGFPFDAQPTVMQERLMRFQDARVSVQELPLEGQPASFRGAVGRFRFAASAQQLKVKAGEPLTMNLQVEGEGNFDRIEVPPVVKPEGWRVYPPESSFAKQDDLGRRGIKNFRVAVVPEVAHRETPAFELSFFDPEAGRYETQQSIPVSLQVEGKLPPVDKPEPVPVPPPPAPKPSSQTEAAPQILEQHQPVAGTPGAGPGSSRWFWGVQGLVALGAGAWAVARGLRLRRERLGPGPVWRKQALQILSKLRALEDPSAFLRQAIECAQLLAAARSGQSPSTMGAAEIALALGLDETARRDLERLFEADAALRFSGANARLSFSEDDRMRVLLCLEGSGR
jgi:hypothetical protein